MASCCLLTLAACHRAPSEAVRLHRFDKVLFETPVDQLQSKLGQVAGEFNTPLLNFQPNNPQYMQMLAGFVQDPTMVEVYGIVDSVFGNMDDFAGQLGTALNKAQKLCPDMRYDKVYTFVSGMFDYDMRVGCNDHELIISLDQYVLPYTERFGYFNSPLFLVKQSRPIYLLTDCMTAIARQRIALQQEHDLTLLDYMVAEGKAIYFAQQALPHAHDSILLRYTSDQLGWMEQYEGNVWTYLQQCELLYETDDSRFHNFIDDAPKTNAFRDSAPRTTDYIGFHIVSGYMKNTGASMTELFNETNSQKILQNANYHPKNRK